MINMVDPETTPPPPPNPPSHNLISNDRFEGCLILVFIVNARLGCIFKGEYEDSVECY